MKFLDRIKHIFSRKDSADGSITNTNNIILWYNTFVGARCNLGYNDTAAGGPYPQVNWSMKGNIYSQWNNKDDTFNNNASAVGGWPVGYNVGSAGNHFRTTASDEWLGEFQGLWMKKGTSAVPLEPGYTNDQSADGGDTSGGDYHLSAGAAALGWYTDDYFLPFDLEGTERTAAEGDLGVYSTFVGGGGANAVFYGMNF